MIINLLKQPQKPMKINSLIANTAKSRLKLRSQWQRNANADKMTNNQKSTLIINTQSSKQNQPKMKYSPPIHPIHLPSEKKFNTFTELSKNRKKSFDRSNSSFQKKMHGEHKEKISHAQRGGKTPKTDKDLESQIQIAYRVYQKMIRRQMVWVGQDKTVTIKKRDLLHMIAISLNPTLDPPQHLAFYAALLRSKQSEEDIFQSRVRKNRKARLRVCSSTLRLSFRPHFGERVVVVPAEDCIAITEKELEPQNIKINNKRKSIFSQQNILNNSKKKGNRIRQQCKLQPNDLNTLQQGDKHKRDLGVQYMAEQNQLLMKFTAQELKKDQAQIYECGVTLKSKLLQAVLELQQLTAQSNRQSFQRPLESTSSIVFNPSTFPSQNFPSIPRDFLKEKDAKEAKLREFIVLKSILISEFLQKMDQWIESSAYKKEFNVNIAKYIHKQGQNMRESLTHISNSLRSVEPLLAIKAQQLLHSLQLFFQIIQKDRQIM